MRPKTCNGCAYFVCEWIDEEDFEFGTGPPHCHESPPQVLMGYSPVSERPEVSGEDRSCARAKPIGFEELNAKLEANGN